MPKRKVLVWGILLKLEKKANRPTLEFKRFYVHITQGSPANPLFFSSPALRKLIDQFPRLKSRKTHIGAICHHWDREKEVFRTATRPFTFLSYSITEAFKQKGIGEALMRKSYRELQKLVGVVRIMPFQSVSDVMLRKLEARGIKVTGREQSDTRHYESTTADMISRINMVRRRRRRLSQERRIRLNRKLK